MSDKLHEVVYLPRFVAWAKVGHAQNWQAVGSGNTRRQCEAYLAGRSHALILPYGDHPALEETQCLRG